MTTRACHHSGRCIRQTVPSFGNGPQILGAMVGRGFLGRPEELTVALQAPGSMSFPNRPGAQVPVYGVFAEDAYWPSWFTDDLGPDLAALETVRHEPVGAVQRTAWLRRSA